MYDEFIRREKEFSDRFLKSQQIITDRFNEDEYIFIKKIMEKDRIIYEIYEIIDDIIRKEKISSDIRFLMIGDFIFSMLPLNIADPENLIIKTTRNDFIKNITMRAEINTNLGCDFRQYIEMQKKLLIGLRIKKILKRIELKIINKDKNWEKIIYMELLIGDMNLEKIGHLGVCNLPFIIDLDKKYSIGSFRNIWKLKKKKKEMEDYPIDTSSIVKANSIKFKLDEKIYNINKELINKEINRVLEEVNCSSIEEYFEKIKIIAKDEKYIKERKMFIEYDNKKIMEIFQKIMVFNLLNKKIFNREYYLPCFIDNRSRHYYGTIFSPTFNKIFRYMSIFVEKKEFIKLEESKFYNKIMKHANLLDGFELDKKEIYIALVLFMEIGKHYIELKNNCFIKVEEIIKLGIENFNKKEKKLKFEEYLYLNRIEYELIKLIKKEKININTIIFKDATASGLQNYGIILGYKEDKLRYLNLDGDDWCDTYTYLINKFIEDNDMRKRKYWKNTIMTIPYNSVWYSCFLKFLDKIREDGIDYNKMDVEKKNKIKLLHKKFYENVKENVKKEFFINDKGELIIFKYRKFEIVNKKEYKITYKKHRDKYTGNLYMIIEDKESTERAMEANNMHYLDALLVKKILEKFDIISIHDCFGIRLCEMHLVIDEINDYYSKIIKKETYNMNIII